MIAKTATIMSAMALAKLEENRDEEDKYKEEVIDISDIRNDVKYVLRYGTKPYWLELIVMYDNGTKFVIAELNECDLRITTLVEMIGSTIKCFEDYLSNEKYKTY